jgi:hypothetical protein
VVGRVGCMHASLCSVDVALGLGHCVESCADHGHSPVPLGHADSRGRQPTPFFENPRVSVLWGRILSVAPRSVMPTGLLCASFFSSTSLWLHRSKQAYLAYRKRTSPVFLLPQAVYAALPLVIKQVFCLELPLYETDWDYVDPTAAAAAGSTAGREVASAETYQALEAGAK